METTPTHQNPSPSTSTTNIHIQTPPLTPRPDPNPYPTTFVQADTTSFKHVVQMLTGPSKPKPKPTQHQDPVTSSKTSIPPIKTSQQKKQGYNKLYERRNGLMINPLPKSSFGGYGGVHEMLSPSVLDFPALVLSPVTPLKEDLFNKLSPASEEERGIAEKGFYLHPSTPRATAEPQLLPLFPVTSPRVTESSI